MQKYESFTNIKDSNTIIFKIFFYICQIFKNKYAEMLIKLLKIL